MNKLRWMRGWSVAALVIATGSGASSAFAYTAPDATPAGITLVDVTNNSGYVAGQAEVPQLLWRRLGDAEGSPLYTYDADQAGKSSCYDACAMEFPPLVADAHAQPSADFTILVRDDHVRQWAYQGKALYRYSGKNPLGEPGGNIAAASFDPASRIYSPKSGWRRAAYLPEKSTLMPPDVHLEGLAIASGFGFIDAVNHMTIYAAPVSHRLSSDWQPLKASALALPVGDFAIIKRADDGTPQWTYHGEALYTYAGDYVAGEVTGIFAGDRSVHAALAYRNFMPPGTAIGEYPGRGPLMEGANGQTLYYVSRFYAMYAGRETRSGYGVTYNSAKYQGIEGCLGDCTKSWHPLLARANAQAQGFWELVARPDGSKQWAFKGSPVYTFIGDKKAGDITGTNRYVIVYGGSQGQIVYADAGGDPRDAQPVLGKIDMEDAVGLSPPPQKRSALNVNVGGVSGIRTGGAGFYWHTVSVLY